MRKALIVDGVRTPIGKFGGALAAVRADDLAAVAIRALLSRNPALPAQLIDDVILGCANQAGEDNRNVARMSLLLAGLPVSVPGETVNRLCGSGLSAVIGGAHAILANEGDLVIAGGVEQMTRAPFVIAKSEKPWGRNPEMFDTTIGWRFINKLLQSKYGTDSMGETAENVATRYQISRADQDAFALNSQQKATRARSGKRFVTEIAPVPICSGGAVGQVENDEFIRPDTTLEKLAALKPAFREGGSVTAGNSSGINDGAAALLLASDATVREQNLKAVAQVVSSASVGGEPKFMGMGPVEASRLALKRAGLTFKDIAIIELNEAFAAQSLAVLRELGVEDHDPRVNPNGGAIALGHPLGMSGARLVLTAMRELELRNAEHALVTMCIGVGQGIAAILRRI